MAIIQEIIEVKISGTNFHHWKNLGYDLPELKGHGRGIKKSTPTLMVRVSDLPPGSRTYVQCRCDNTECGKVYNQRVYRNTNTCEACRRSQNSVGNKHGTAHKGRKNPYWNGTNNPRHKQDMSGEKHHNWNPLKTEFAAYRYQVQKLTEANYRLFKDKINPHDYPRKLNGTEGGYQLDHMISIKNGFRAGLPPEKIAHSDNLQMLPWATNRAKWHK